MLTEYYEFQNFAGKDYLPSMIFLHKIVFGQSCFIVNFLQHILVQTERRMLQRKCFAYTNTEWKISEKNTVIRD